jgi:hypothetical protein
MTLYVVYSKRTGHVLGAVNAIGGTPPQDAAAMIGDALPLRVTVDGTTAVLSLPVNDPFADLAVHEADDEPGVFANPLHFGVELVPDPKPALLHLAEWSEGLAFTQHTLLITVPSEGEANVLVLFDEPDSRPVPGKMAAGEDTAEVPVTVSAGQHGALILVAGWQGRLEEVTKP